MINQNWSKLELRLETRTELFRMHAIYGLKRRTGTGNWSKITKRETEMTEGAPEPEVGLK